MKTATHHRTLDLDDQQKFACRASDQKTKPKPPTAQRPTGQGSQRPAKDRPAGQKTIALNRKAHHEYTLEQRFEAGLVLQGWEVKSMRASKAQIADSYVLIKKGEAWLIGSNINPLISASTHVHPDPGRTRKLLLNRRELNTLIGLSERQGYTLIPLALYWKFGRAKLEIALAKGKKQYDKRETQKDRDWEKDKQRMFKKKL